MSARQPQSFNKVQIEHADVKLVSQLNRMQDRISETTRQIASNPVLGMPDYRVIELAGASGALPTFAVQYRKVGTQTWTTIFSLTSLGIMSLANLPNGTTGQLLRAGASVPVWAGDTTWTAVLGGVGFQNSWVNVGGSNQLAGFFKDAGGFVHLRGAIKSGTLAVAAFTLPAGYRPSASMFFPAVVTSGGTIGYCSITSAGVVAMNGGDSTFDTLDGISFDTR